MTFVLSSGMITSPVTLRSVSKSDEESPLFNLDELIPKMKKSK